jgi:hypothetical protein
MERRAYSILPGVKIVLFIYTFWETSGSRNEAWKHLVVEKQVILV